MQHESSNGGFVQVMVVAGIAALAALVVAGLSSTQSADVTAAALERTLRVDVLSRAAFERVLAALESRPDTFEQQALAGPTELEISDQAVAVSVEGEAGKIDLLQAPLPIVARLAENLGLPAGARTTLMEELEEARRERDPAGALDLVRQRLALLADDLDAVVTVFGSQHIDPTYAATDAFEAIPDLSPTEIAQILSAPPSERGQFAAMSEHFATDSRRFSIAVRIAWAPDQVSVRRLPIELSTSGRAIVLAGAY